MGKRSVFDAFAAAAGYYNQSIGMADAVFVNRHGVSLKA